MQNAFSNEDINSAIKVLKSKNITMSSQTSKFEREFAKKIGANYAVMVNSGSSANLMALKLITNQYRNYSLKKGSEVLLPALCWPTSYWPIIQSGLVAKFVDIDLNTLSISTKSIEKSITSKTKAILIIHVLGIPAKIDDILKIAKKYNLLIIEDTCESLGSLYNSKFLGTFGDVGTFSFYYSHHMTTGEGGMVVCKNKEDYNILLALRSHGWSRHTAKKLNLNIPFNKKFEFINEGFNLRPTDIQASIGISQLKYLKENNKNRVRNYELIKNTIIKNKKWNSQFIFFEPSKLSYACWFGLPLLINRKYKINVKKYFEYLDKESIEIRPIISGNFLKQPVFKKYKINQKYKSFKNTNIVDSRGFFIGIGQNKITKIYVLRLANILLNGFDEK